MNRFFLSVLFLLFVTFPFRLFADRSPVYPNSVTVLTQESFVGHPYFSVADALRDVPSLNLVRVGGPGTKVTAKIRGGGTEKYVDVFLDGESLSESFDGSIDLSQIPIALVERIEISRGGGPVSWGTGAAHGIINIVTLRPSQKGLVTRIGTGVGRDGVKHSHGQFTGRSHLGDLTYAGSVQDSSGFLSNEDSQQNNHFINLTRSFNGKGFWGLEYYFQKSDVGLGQGTLVPFNEWNSHLEKTSANEFRLKSEEDQHAKMFILSPQSKWGQVRASITRRSRDSNIFSQKNTASLEDRKNQSVDGHLSWSKNNWEGGLERSSYRHDLFPQSQARLWKNSLYLTTHLKNQLWTLAPGLRYTTTSHEDSFLDRRVALIMTPSPRLNFSSTIQTTHRNPTLNELNYSSSPKNNSNLSSESALSSDFGISWMPQNNWTVKLTQFNIHAQNLSEPNSSDILSNSGREVSHGLESQVRWQTSRQEWAGHWTVQSTRHNGSASSFSPKRMGTLQWTAHLPRSIQMTHTWRYQSEQWTQLGESGLRLPSYYTWDVRFGFHVLSAILYFETHNLTRRRYADTIDVFTSPSGPRQELLSPQAERTFWAGLSIRFEN